MDYINQAVSSTWAIFQYVCLVYCVGMVLESVWPAEQKQALDRIGFNILWTFIFLLVTNLLVPPFNALTKPLIDKYGLHIPIAFGDSFFGQLCQVLAFFFIADFFYYWFHRSQHRFNWLWAQHRIHHSEYGLNVTTGNRHHWLEEPLRVFAIWLPIGLLFMQRPVTLGWLWAGFLLWGYFIHLNVRLSLGPLTSVMAGPQLHRIHHSFAVQHLDKNFAAFFPVFDVVFGTYYKPARGEFPVTGLTDGENLNGVVRASIAPFTYLYRRFGERTPGEALHPESTESNSPGLPKA